MTFLNFTIVFWVGVGLMVLLPYLRKRNRRARQLRQPFPEAWRTILQNDVLFYHDLDADHQRLFEQRVQRFLTTKNIEAIDTEMDDAIRVMVASSAVIPTFAFPEYNYPDVHTVLIYPNSFDEQFQTQRFEGHQEFISGMVGNRFMNGTVILSKPDLVKAFDGHLHEENVGIHEFVHLLDKEDGVIDGVPQLLLEHRYVGPWLHEIKHEMDRIHAGKSDINPYALTNNAEFLAVVSEYFFSNPSKFKAKHPDLYAFLADIYNTTSESR